MIKQISLFFKDDRSDKVYNVFLQEQGEGYVVNFSFGRRGSSLASGTKTQSPVALVSAEKIFDKLVAEKVAKQYKAANSVSGVTVGELSKEDSGINCQLLNPIEEHEIEKYLNSDRYVAQEKHDSRRFLLEKKGSVLRGINRKGQVVAHDSALQVLAESKYDFIIDSEAMDGFIYAFDLLSLNNADLRGESFETRVGKLEMVCDIIDEKVLLFSTPAFGEKAKRELLTQLKSGNKEGIVFKDRNARYIPGRPASGGNQLKYKFYKTASFFVKQTNNKRSVLLGLINDLGKEVEAGNVTIPANHDIPSGGDIVEVRYLYAFENSGAVFQPVYLGKRKDIDKAECKTSQLTFKAEEAAVV